jgi:mannosyl-3-phosphoglycerate phosphatase family protein
VQPAHPIIFTDLDGTLLDHHSYSFAAAGEALDLLRREKTPLIFCTSKTRAEVEPLRRKLGNTHPFITENGGGVFIPDGYFPKRIQGAVKVRHYACLALGRPYEEICGEFDALLEETAVSAEGFHQMTARAIAENTGLSREEARWAAQREFDLPFFFAGAAEKDHRRFRAAAARRGLTVAEGGRFCHLFAGGDKGQATRRLIQLYRASLPHSRLRTAALGDSPNDLPMLTAVDHPIVLPQRRDEFNDILLEKLPRAAQAPAPGPAGWNAAVLALLGR